MTDHDQPLDLPFELNPPGQHLDLANAKLSGGCIVMASVIPDKPPRPALVFRFAAPDGRFYAPIVLAIDPAKADAEQTVWTVISAESTFSTKNDVITLDPSEYRRIK